MQVDRALFNQSCGCERENSGLREAWQDSERKADPKGDTRSLTTLATHMNDVSQPPDDVAFSHKKSKLILPGRQKDVFNPRCDATNWVFVREFVVSSSSAHVGCH